MIILIHIVDMNINALRQEGVACINRAVDLDGENYDESFKMYISGVGKLLVAVKYEKNNAAKKVMLKMINGYITRAEIIREELNRRHSEEKIQPIKESNDENSALKNNILSTMINPSDINVSWDDVAGLERAKETIREAVILPLKFPQLYTGSRKPWKGILLYGPPGTGKSFLAKAVASESNSTFFSVSSSDLISKWQGESERAVKVLFETAREKAPSVVFIDEIDSLAGERSEGEQDSMRRVKTEFLVQMQGVNGSSDDTKRVLVLGATNTPWTLDPAFRRRFEKRIFIPLPNLNARIYMFRAFLKNVEHDIGDHELTTLGKMTENYSGSDIGVVLRDALMAPIRKCQSAKQFKVGSDGKWSPVSDYPSCHKCPMDLTINSSYGKTCTLCGAICVKMDDIPDPSLLSVPVVSFNDVVESIKKNSSSVSNHELDQYAIWTNLFGQEGI